MRNAPREFSTQFSKLAKEHHVIYFCFLTTQTVVANIKENASYVLATRYLIHLQFSWITINNSFNKKQRDFPNRSQTRPSTVLIDRSVSKFEIEKVVLWKVVTELGEFFKSEKVSSEEYGCPWFKGLWTFLIRAPFWETLLGWSKFPLSVTAEPPVGKLFYDTSPVRQV
jgi:hypothetical protein